MEEQDSGQGVSAPPLHDALANCDFEAAHAVLRAGAHPDQPYGGDDETPLHIAIGCCRQPALRHALVRLLLSYGASPQRTDADGRGPLFLALLHQDIALLEMLLEHGADPNTEVGFADKSLLWWARSEYLYETYGRELPEQPALETLGDADALIAWLDGLALRHSRPQPEAMRLLRAHGAEFMPPEIHQDPS